MALGYIRGSVAIERLFGVKSDGRNQTTAFKMSEFQYGRTIKGAAGKGPNIITIPRLIYFSYSVRGGEGIITGECELTASVASKNELTDFQRNCRGFSECE